MVNTAMLIIQIRAVEMHFKMSDFMLVMENNLSANTLKGEHSLRRRKAQREKGKRLSPGKLRGQTRFLIYMKYT